MKNQEQQFFESSPKILKNEAQYSNQKKSVDNYVNKIKDNLEKRDDIEEKDQIRLTRILQLIERYKPDRKATQDEQDSLILIDALKNLYRLIFKRRDNKEEKLDNLYLLAEESISALRKLRHYDHNLQNFQEEYLNEDKILNQEMSGKIISSEILDTSLTLEYEKKKWGVDRICLDGIQNHLPSDSGGEKIWIQCLIDNKWVSLEEAQTQKDKIKSVRLVDDGVGFDVKNLILLWSTKSDELESRGQFGEGMKLIAASSVRENLEMELQSQNWSAKPFGKEINVKNTRNKTEEQIQQLSFNVDHHDQENIIGSRTIFHKPSKKFIDEILKMPNKILELSEDYKPVFTSEHGQIVSKKGGEIFVKGIFVGNEDLIFSYNFDNVETNRDRNVIMGGVANRISNIINELNDKNLIKILLQKSLQKINSLEFYYNVYTKYPSLWREAFYEIFGEDACLKTNFELPESFPVENDTTKKITLSHGLRDFLIKCEVKTDKDVMPVYEETIPTSVTLEYGKDIWNEERIMLDAIQNHLPRDAEGQSIYLRFQTKEGDWHYFDELKNYKDEDIQTIKISNAGSVGYDYRLLGIFQSIKDEEVSSGKWGEGLKMLSAACLRNNIEMSLRSRNWKAIPKIHEQEIDGKKIQQLVFNVLHEIKDGAVRNEDPDHNYYDKSATTFYNPSKELIGEFRHANEKILSIEKINPIATTKNSEILRLTDGELFVRDIKIPGNHNLLYSYHFPHFDIKTRDRNAITKKDLMSELSQTWASIDKQDVIKDFLHKSSFLTENKTDEEFLEFQTDFNPSNHDLWIKTYRDLFGKETAVRDVRSQDFNLVHQLEHIGLRAVTMPTKISDMLKKLVGSNGDKIVDYSDKVKSLTDVKFVDKNMLSEEEKKVIDLLYKLDEFLPKNKKLDIKIYERKFDGQDVAAGFTDHTSISLFRGTLLNLVQAADVYYHEKTHTITFAQDAAAGFRNFLSRALAELAVRQLPKDSIL